jgi:myo-inositol catabolism protein IolC
VDCIVLGRGADWDKVTHWLEVAAGVSGFAGFAVGRTLWHDALVDHLAGRTSDTETARTIADRYRQLIDLYNWVAATAADTTDP